MGKGRGHLSFEIRPTGGKQLPDLAIVNLSSPTFKFILSGESCVKIPWTMFTYNKIVHLYTKQST